MSERWKQIERLYHQALERETSTRAAFLAEACAGDEELRREVVSLIAYDRRRRDNLRVRRLAPW